MNKKRGGAAAKPPLPLLSFFLPFNTPPRHSERSEEPSEEPTFPLHSRPLPYTVAICTTISNILQEYPHSLSYHDTTFTKFGFN